MHGKTYFPLSKASIDRNLTDIRICRETPIIYRLLFVDDGILFYKANLQESMTILKQLTLYENAWGQKINRTKTSITFSSNVQAITQRLIMDFWGPAEIQQQSRCLGLPVWIG